MIGGRMERFDNELRSAGRFGLCMSEWQEELMIVCAVERRVRDERTSK